MGYDLIQSDYTACPLLRSTVKKTNMGEFIPQKGGSPLRGRERAKRAPAFRSTLFQVVKKLRFLTRETARLHRRGLSPSLVEARALPSSAQAAYRLPPPGGRRFVRSAAPPLPDTGCARVGAQCASGYFCAGKARTKML